MGVDEQVALVSAYAAATVRLRQALASAISGLWLGLGSWREEDADSWVDQVTPIVAGSVAAMTSMTDAYLTALLADQLGGALLAAGAARATYPRPTPIVEVYRRPLVTTWTSLSRGSTVTAAIQAGRARAESLATTDVQLAKRDASAARLAAESRVVGYRRVLTGSRSCALCALAASQRYHRTRLMPIHPGCNCAVAPIVGQRDPGQRINAAAVGEDATFEATGDGASRRLTDGQLDELGDTDALHQAIAARFGASGVDHGGRAPDYRDYVVEHTHGELGPVLARKGDHFTSPDDLDL